jgi:hypothetical protein
MRNLLLILLIVWLLLSATLGSRILIIQLEIPPELIPYYDWLLSFPGINPPANNRQPEQNSPYPSRSA